MGNVESSPLSRLMHVDVTIIVTVWVVHDRQCDDSISGETVQPSATLHSLCHDILTLVTLNGASECSVDEGWCCGDIVLPPVMLVKAKACFASWL